MQNLFATFLYVKRDRGDVWHMATPLYSHTGKDVNIHCVLSCTCMWLHMSNACGVSDQGGMCEVLEKDLYAVLGARPTDSALQLKHRYQQLALQVNAAHTHAEHRTWQFCSTCNFPSTFCLTSVCNNFITCARVFPYFIASLPKYSYIDTVVSTVPPRPSATEGAFNCGLDVK